jgi:hypothetical protein
MRYFSFKGLVAVKYSSQSLRKMSYFSFKGLVTVLVLLAVFEGNELLLLKGRRHCSTS